MREQLTVISQAFPWLGKWYHFIAVALKFEQGHGICNASVGLAGITRLVSCIN